MGVVFLFAAIQTVSQDGYPLRDACDPSASIVERLRRGDPVEVRFAINGELGSCYKVSVTTEGKNIQGYLPASALTGIEQFDRARASGAGLNAQAPARAPAQSRSVALQGNLATRASQLLSANQPEEALRLIEQALRANRGDAGLLAMAGLAAHQSDRARDAVAYWEESLALAPSPSVERLLNQARREVDSDQSAQKLVGIRFNFRYDDREVTPEQARSLVPILDSEYTRIAEQLGCEAGERITAVIQSREAYLKTTGAAEWSGGQFDGRIRIALLELTPGEETRRAFAHEIVHACLARTGRWPAWLHEGLAQRFSGQTVSEAQRAIVQQMARNKQLPSLATMGQTWSRLSTQHAAAAYATALMAADLFYAHYGIAGVRSLLQNPAMLDHITADLDRRLRE